MGLGFGVWLVFGFVLLEFMFVVWVVCGVGLSLFGWVGLVGFCFGVGVCLDL